MRVSVHHTIGILADDMQSIPARARGGLNKATRKRLTEGQKVARMLAKATARSHGKHYPPTITAELTGPFSGEWGPDIVLQKATMFRRRGSGKGWSYEGGSRNQPPHRDIERSGDLVVPKWHDDITDVIDGLFW